MILDDIMKYRAQQLEREKAACGLDAMKVRAEKLWLTANRFR